MTNITHVMLDIELFGLHLGAPLWNIGACSWDQTADSFQPINKVDIFVPPSLQSGPASAEALEFAKKSMVLDRTYKETKAGMVTKLYLLLDLLSIEGVEVYCKGASFDYPRLILFLEHLVKHHELVVAKELLVILNKKYRELLCMRQNIRMFPMMPKGYPIEGAHGGLADSIAQAEATYFHLRALEKLVYSVEEDTIKPKYCLPAEA